jgi:hypothetical protein
MSNYIKNKLVLVFEMQEIPTQRESAGINRLYAEYIIFYLISKYYIDLHPAGYHWHNHCYIEH